MKQFKKQHKRLPRPGAVARLIRRYAGPVHIQRYQTILRAKREGVIPEAIVEVCLAAPDPNKRQNIEYFPDLRTFMNWDCPNRSLPVQKFMDMFRGFISQEDIEYVVNQMTNFRLEFCKTEEEWIKAYDDENIDSCMTGQDIVRCYAHPENDLALAVLYPPGEKHIIARTIVNTKEKWWVRLFGDDLLCEKLIELGYKRLNRPPTEFKMYGFWPDGPEGDEPIKFPYFDMYGHAGGKMKYRADESSWNPDTELVECIINPVPNGMRQQLGATWTRNPSASPPLASPPPAMPVDSIVTSNYVPISAPITPPTIEVNHEVTTPFLAGDFAA